jgi:hypothetical protein
MCQNLEEVQRTNINASQPARDQHLDPLAHNFLSIGSELDPVLGSYYANISAIFRGGVSFYNLTAVSDDTTVTWHTLAENFMNETNVTSIPKYLGTWSWMNTDKIGIKVHDKEVIGAGNAIGPVAVVHVSESKFVYNSLMILPDHRVRSNYSIRT